MSDTPAVILNLVDKYLALKEDFMVLKKEHDETLESIKTLTFAVNQQGKALKTLVEEGPRVTIPNQRANESKAKENANGRKSHRPDHKAAIAKLREDHGPDI